MLRQQTPKMTQPTSDDSILTTTNFASRIRTIISEETCAGTTFEQLAMVQTNAFGNADKFQLASVYGILLDHSDLIHKPGQKIAAAFLIWALYKNGSSQEAFNPLTSLLIRLLRCNPTSHVSHQSSVHDGNELNDAERSFLKCLLAVQNELREMLSKTPREVYFMDAERLPHVDMRSFLEEYERSHRDGNISPAVPFQDSAIAAFLQQFEYASPQQTEIRQQLSRLQAQSSQPPVTQSALPPKVPAPEDAAGTTAGHLPAELSSSSLSFEHSSATKVTSSRQPPASRMIPLSQRSAFPAAAAAQRSNYLDLGDSSSKTRGADDEIKAFESRLHSALLENPLLMGNGEEDEEEEEDDDEDDDDDDDAMSSSNSMRANSDSDDDNVVVTDEILGGDLDEDDDEDDDNLEPGDADDSDADPDFDPTEGDKIVGAGFSVAQRAGVSGVLASRLSASRAVVTVATSIGANDDGPPPLVSPSPTKSLGRQNSQRQLSEQMHQPSSQNFYANGGNVAVSNESSAEAENGVPVAEQAPTIDSRMPLPEQPQQRRLPTFRINTTTGETSSYHRAGLNVRRSHQHQSHYVHQQHHADDNCHNNDMIKINFEVLHDDSIEYDHQHRKLRRGRIYEDLEKKMSSLHLRHVAVVLARTCLDNISKSEFPIPALAALDCLARHEHFGFDVTYTVVENTGNFLNTLIVECEQWADAVIAFAKCEQSDGVAVGEEEDYDDEDSGDYGELAKKLGDAQKAVAGDKDRRRETKIRSSSALISSEKSVVRHAALRLWFIQSWLDLLYRWRLQARKKIRDLSVKNELDLANAAAAAVNAEIVSAAASTVNPMPTSVTAAVPVDTESARLLALIERVQKSHLNIEHLNRLWRCFGIKLGCTDQIFNFLVLCVSRIPRHRQNHDAVDEDNVDENGFKVQTSIYHEVRPYFQSIAVVVHIVRQFLPNFMRSRIDAQHRTILAAATDEEVSTVCSSPRLLSWPQSLNAALECYKICCLYFARMFDPFDSEEPVTILEGCTWQQLALTAIDFLWFLTVDDSSTSADLPKNELVATVQLADVHVQQHDYVLMRIIELLNILTFDLTPADADVPDVQAREKAYLLHAVEHLQIIRNFVANSCRSFAVDAADGDFDDDIEKLKLVSKRNVFVARKAAALLHRVVMTILKHMAAYRAQFAYHLQIRSQMGQNVLPLLSASTAPIQLQSSLTNCHVPAVLSLSTASSRIEVFVQISWKRRKSSTSPKLTSLLQYRANLPLQMHVGDLKACIMTFIYKKYEEERGGFQLIWQQAQEQRSRQRNKLRMQQQQQHESSSLSSQPAAPPISSAAGKIEREAASEADSDDSFDNNIDSYTIESDSVAGNSNKLRENDCWYWKHVEQESKLSRRRLFLFNSFVREHEPLMLYYMQIPATASTSTSSSATVSQQQQRLQTNAVPVEKLLVYDRYTLAECNLRESANGHPCRLTAVLEGRTAGSKSNGGESQQRHASSSADARKSQELIAGCWPTWAFIPHVYFSQQYNVDMLFDVVKQIYGLLVQHQPTLRNRGRNVLLLEPQAVLYWRQCLRRVWDLLMMQPAPHALLAEFTHFQQAPQFASSSSEAATSNVDKAAFWRRLLPFDADEIVLDDDDDENDAAKLSRRARNNDNNVLPILLYRLVLLERVKAGPLYSVYRAKRRSEEWIVGFQHEGGVQRLLNLLTSMPLLSAAYYDSSDKHMTPVPNDEFAWRRDTLTVVLKALETLLLRNGLEWQTYAEIYSESMMRKFRAAQSAAEKQQQQPILQSSLSQPQQANGIEDVLYRSGKRRYSLTNADRQPSSINPAAAAATRCHAVSENGSSTSSITSKDSVDDATFDAAQQQQQQRVGNEPPRKKTLLSRADITDPATASPSSNVASQQQRPAHVAAQPAPAARVYANSVTGTFFGAARPDVAYAEPTGDEQMPNQLTLDNNARPYKSTISFVPGSNFAAAKAPNSTGRPISFKMSRELLQQQPSLPARDAALVQHTRQINENLHRTKSVLADEERNSVCVVDEPMLPILMPSIARIVHALLTAVSDSLPTLYTMPVLIDAINCAGVSSPQLMQELHTSVSGNNNGSGVSVGMLTTTYPPVQMFESYDTIRAALLCQQKRIARSAMRLLLSWALVSDRVVPLICCCESSSNSGDAASSSLYGRYLHRVLVQSLSDDMSTDQLQRLEDVLRRHFGLYRDVMPLVETLKLLFAMVPTSVAQKGGCGTNRGSAIVDAAVEETRTCYDAEGNKIPAKITESTLALLDVGFQTFILCTIPVSRVRLFAFLSVIIDAVPDDAIVKHNIDLTAHLEWLAQQIALRPIYESRHNYFVAQEGDGDAVLVGMLQVCSAILAKRASLAVTNITLCERLASLCRQILFAQPNIAVHNSNNNTDAAESENDGDADLASSPFAPKCKSAQTRQAAYALLNGLCNHNAQLYRSTGEQLITQHAPRSPTTAVAVSSAALYGWDYWPRDEIRSECDRIGIVNLGATCYMACTMQQLFMIPQLREAVLRVRQCEKAAKNTLEVAPPDAARVIGPKNQTDSSNSAVLERILRELQHMFAYMMLSQRKAYNPDMFVRQYEMHGERLNPSEQKDMQEFYTDLLDKLSDMSPELKRVIGDTFEGRLCNSVICCDDECPHFSLRDEVFTSVHIPVQGYDDVAASLEHVTAEDALDGDNKYFCAECKKMVRAMKRTSFRTLPKVLALNPMRYNFDTTTMARIKINSRFSFPDKLSMERFSEHNLLPARVKQAQKVLADEETRRNAAESLNAASADERVSMPNTDVVGAAVTDASSSPDSRLSSGIESSKENSMPKTSTTPLLLSALQQCVNGKSNNKRSCLPSSPPDDEIESGSDDASSSSRCSSAGISTGVDANGGVFYPPKKPESPLGDASVAKRQRLTPPQVDPINENNEIGDFNVDALKSAIVAAKFSADATTSVEQPVSATAPPPVTTTSAATNSSLSPTPKEQQLQCFDYILVGVTVHTGTSEAGHYYAYIYDLEAEGEPQWLSFNDTEVRRFDVSCLPNEAFGGNLPPISFGRGANDSLLGGGGGGGGGYLDLALERCNSAYMLFYEREDVFRERRDALRKIRKCSEFGASKVELPFLNVDNGVVRSERASRLRNRARIQSANDSNRPSVVSANKSIMQYYVNTSAELMPPDLLQWMVADNCRFTNDLCVFDRGYTKFLMRFCQNALFPSPQTTRDAQQKLLAAAAAQQHHNSKPTHNSAVYEPALNDSACQFLATRLATVALLETLVHSRDRHHLTYFFEFVTKCLQLSSDYSEWFLEMLLQPTTMWLVDVLVRCPLMPRRDLLRKLVMLAFKSVHARVTRKLRAGSTSSTSAAADPQQLPQLNFDYYFDLLQIIQKEQRQLKNQQQQQQPVNAADAAGNAVLTITIDDDDDDEDGDATMCAANFDSGSLLLAKVMHKLVGLVYADETIASYRFAGQLFELIHCIANIGDAECCAFVHFGYLAACTRLYHSLGEQRTAGLQGSLGGGGNSSSLAATLSAALLQAAGSSTSNRGLSANGEPQQVSDDEFGPLNNAGDFDAANSSDLTTVGGDELLMRRRNSTSSRLSNNNNGTYLNFNGTNNNNFSALSSSQQNQHQRVCTALDGMSATLRATTERYQLFCIGAAHSASSSNSDEDWEIDFDDENHRDASNNNNRSASDPKSSQHSQYSIEATLYEQGTTEDDFIGMIVSLIADSPLFVEDLAKTLACFCLGENTITTVAAAAAAAIDDDGFQPVLPRPSRMHHQPHTQPDMDGNNNNNEMDANNDFDLSGYSLAQQQRFVKPENVITTTGEKSAKVVDLLVERICGPTLSSPQQQSSSMQQLIMGGGSSPSKSAFGRPTGGGGGANNFTHHNSNNSFSHISRQREVANLLQAVSTLARLSGQQYVTLQQTLQARQHEAILKTLGLTAAAKPAAVESKTCAPPLLRMPPPHDRLTQCPSFVDLILPRVPQMFLRYPEAVVEWLQADAVRIEPLREHVLLHIADMIRHVLIAGVNSFTTGAGGQPQQQYRYADNKHVATYSTVGSLPIIAIRKEREQLIQQLCVLALLVAMPFPRDPTSTPTPSYVHGLITQALNYNGGGLAAVNYEEHPTLLRYLSTTRSANTVTVTAQAAAVLPGMTVVVSPTTTTTTRCIATNEIRTLFANLFSVVGWLEIVYGRIQQQQQQQSNSAAGMQQQVQQPSQAVTIVAGDSITAYFVLLTWLMDATQDDLVCSKFAILQHVFVLQMQLQQLGARDEMRWALMLFCAAGVRYLPKFRYLVLHDAEMQHCFLKSPLFTLQQQLIATNSLLTNAAAGGSTQWDVASKLLNSATTRRNNNILPALAAAAAVQGGPNIATLWQKSYVILRCLGQWLIYKSNLALVDRQQCVALGGNATAANEQPPGSATAGVPQFVAVLNDLLLYAVEPLPSSNSTFAVNGTLQQQQILHCIDQSLRILFETIPRKIAEGTYSVNNSSSSFDFAALVGMEYGAPMEFCPPFTAAFTANSSRATVAEPSTAAAILQPQMARATSTLTTATTVSSLCSNVGKRRQTPPEHHHVERNNDSVVSAMLLLDNNNNNNRNNSPIFSNAAPAAYIEQLLESMPMPPPSNRHFAGQISGFELSPPPPIGNNNNTPAGTTTAQPTNSSDRISTNSSTASSSSNSSSSVMPDNSTAIVAHNIMTNSDVADNVRVKQVLLNLRVQIIRSVVNCMTNSRKETRIRCHRLVRRLLYCPSDVMNILNMEDDEQNAHAANDQSNNNDDSVAACFELDADDCCMLLRAFRARIYRPLITIIAHHIACYRQQQEIDRADKAFRAANNARGQQQHPAADLNSSNSSANSPEIAIFTRDNQVELHFAITRLQSMLGLVEPRTKQLQAELEQVEKQLIQCHRKLKASLSPRRAEVVESSAEAAVDIAAESSHKTTTDVSDPAAVAVNAEPSVSRQPKTDHTVSVAQNVPSSVDENDDLTSIIAATTQLEQRRQVLTDELESLIECRKNVDQLLRASTNDLRLSINLSMLIDYGFEIFASRLAAKDAQIARATMAAAAAAANAAAAGGGGAAASSSRKAVNSIVSDDDDDEDDDDDDDIDGGDDEDDDDEDNGEEDDDEDVEDDDNDDDADEDDEDGMDMSGDDDDDDDDRNNNNDGTLASLKSVDKKKDNALYNDILGKHLDNVLKAMPRGNNNKNARRFGMASEKNDAIAQALLARQLQQQQQRKSVSSSSSLADDDDMTTSEVDGVSRAEQPLQREQNKPAEQQQSGSTSRPLDSGEGAVCTPGMVMVPGAQPAMNVPKAP